MKLNELFESIDKEVAIIFGRFNPPHVGHVEAWKKAAESSIWYVGTNQTTVGPTDPLPYDVKVAAMEAMMPEIAGHIVPEQSWWTLATYVYKKHGEVTLYVVTDEKDAKVFVPGLQSQNGKESKHGYYNFKSIEWRPADRITSATDLRSAVLDGDKDKFTKAAGVDADKKVMGIPFFDLVAKHLLPYADQIRAKAEKAAKKKSKETTENFEYKMKKGVSEVSKSTLDRYVSKAVDAHGDADFSARMSKNDPDKRSYHVDQKKTAEKRRQGISRALDRMSKEGVAEGVFGLSAKEKGKIQYVTAKISDIPGNWDHKNQTYTEQGLKDLKSVMKNEKYLKYALSLTADDFDESVEEGWKEKLAAAGLAATIGLGAATGANARVLPGADPSINRFTGEPVATQQVKKDSEEKRYDFSTEYLKKVADGKHPRPMISVDDAKKELERRGISLDEGWKEKLAALGAAGAIGLSGAAGAADRAPEAVKEPIVATLVIDGETKKLDLTPKGFDDVRDAEKWIKGFLKDRGIIDWQGKIERSPGNQGDGTGRYQRITIIGAGGLESVNNEDIRKVKGGYRLVSKNSGKNLGTYPTRAGAIERERQVQYFKHKGK